MNIESAARSLYATVLLVDNVSDFIGSLADHLEETFKVMLDSEVLAAEDFTLNLIYIDLALILLVLGHAAIQAIRKPKRNEED